MRWIGEGSELWRVRVDLFADDDRATRVSASFAQLLSLLAGEAARGDAGADQGLGVAGRPVVGLLFWVRADDVGQAATLAVDTARRAGAGHGVGPELYDVTVIPSAAVVHPDHPGYPAMPD